MPPLRVQRTSEISVTLVSSVAEPEWQAASAGASIDWPTCPASTGSSSRSPAWTGTTAGPRSWPGAARRRVRGHLHRPAPDARADRRDRDPGGRRRGRAVLPLGRAHDAVPAGRHSSCASRAPATWWCSAAASSPRTTSPSSRRPASRRSSRPAPRPARSSSGSASAWLGPPGLLTWTSTSTRARTCSARTASRCPTRRRRPRRRRPAEAAERLGGHVAVKVQVQIGGRGKGGGIVLVRLARGGGARGGPDARARGSGHAGDARAGRAARRHRRGVLRGDHAGPERRAPTWRWCPPRAAWTSRRSPGPGPRRSAASHVDPSLGLRPTRCAT